MSIRPGEILELIRSGTATTRGDIIEHTGLSRMTVAQRLEPLLAGGLLVEGDSGVSTGGRRRKQLRFNTSRSTIAVASIDTTHTTALTDLAGTVLAESTLDILVSDGPVPVLSSISEAIGELIRDAPAPLAGIGVSVPGPVDPATGRPSEPPIMPGWDAYPIEEFFHEHAAQVPVHTANDADAGAVGEYYDDHQGSPSIVFVKVSTGIGTGIVINGRRYMGTDGGAGDIGHVRVEHADEVCQCGATGCLAAVASGRAVARRLRERGHDARSGRDVEALLAAGDRDAILLVQEAGRRIGEVLATVVCVLNPEVVILGGALASSHLISGVRESLYSRSLPRATRHLNLQLGQLGGHAATTGLSHIVNDREFGADAVNRKLLGQSSTPSRQADRQR